MIDGDPPEAQTEFWTSANLKLILSTKEIRAGRMDDARWNTRLLEDESPTDLSWFIIGPERPGKSGISKSTRCRART
jgi:hypothetical protein